MITAESEKKGSGILGEGGGGRSLDRLPTTLTRGVGVVDVATVDDLHVLDGVADLVYRFGGTSPLADGGRPFGGAGSKGIAAGQSSWWWSCVCRRSSSKTFLIDVRASTGSTKPGR